MSKLRSINTAFWSDTWIEELDPNYKLLFIYLVTNDKTNMLGIYESSVRKIAFETGLSVDVVNNGLKAFERIKKVKYINNYIILVNYMKHQNYNTNMKKSAIDIYNNLPKELRNSKLNVSKSDPLKGFESLLNHYGMVRKVEVEDEIEDEDEDEVELSDDVLFSVEILRQKYLDDERIVKSVCEQNKITKEFLENRLTQFNKHLESSGIYSKKWSDYTKHFLNWNKKAPKEITNLTDAEKHKAWLSKTISF